MHQSRIRAFSLLELAIVISIISILAAICYPSFTDYFRALHREEAKLKLRDLANQMSRFYLLNQSFVGAEQLINLSNQASAKYHYQLVKIDKRHFHIITEPIGSQSNDHCGAWHIESDGRLWSDSTANECQ